MFRVLKCIAILLLFLAAGIAIALYLLYFRRNPLSPTAPHARVEPVISTIPGMSACWIETGKTFSSFSFGSTAGDILVRHPTRLSELHEKVPGLAIIPAHGRSAYKKFFPCGPMSCISVR
jgi:hypothetical protein